MNAEEIQKELRRIALLIDVKSEQLPTICQLQGGGRPNIEISDDGTLSYEAYERGSQIFYFTFTDLDELMYHTFREIVPQLANRYATDREASGQDFYQSFFSKKIELMAKAKPEWGKRMEAEQQAGN